MRASCRHSREHPRSITASDPKRRLEKVTRPRIRQATPGKAARLRGLMGLCMLLSCGLANGHAQSVREGFADDPAANGRFIQRTAGTESRFTYNPAGQNLTAVLDTDSSAAYYLSGPMPAVTEGIDASFSTRFRVDAFDPTEHPNAFIGLLTDQHVGDFGDGLVLVLSAGNNSLVAHANIESFDQTFSGSAIPLELQTEYLAVGRYRSASRQFAVEIFSGPGFTNLIGFSTTVLPTGQSVQVNRVGLQNGGSRDLDSTAGSFTIVIDDLFTPANHPRTISIADSTVVEADSGTTNVVLQVQLSLPSSLPIAASYSTVNGTAVAGSDYISHTGTVTFPPGITTASVAIPVLGDSLYESTEAFTVQLSNATDASITRPAGTATIFDNDPRPLLAITDTSVLEGNSGSRSLEFAVTLSTSSGQSVLVDFATADGGATQGADYAAQLGTLEFLPGEVTQRIRINILGDTTEEADETFFVNLSNPTNAGLAKAQGAGTIFDDDAAPRISISDLTVSEGNLGTAAAVFEISLTRPSASEVSVGFAAVDGSANVGTDFIASSGRITLPAGTVRTTVTIPVIGDTVPELDETFSVRLSNSSPPSATIAKAIGTATIQNDDPFPELTIQDASIPEPDSGAAAAVVVVQLSFPIDRPVLVDFDTADGTAVAVNDYTAQAGIITIPAGATSQTISVPVLGDILNEANETFLVRLSNPSFARLLRAESQVTIVDQDPQPMIFIEDVSVPEGNSGRANAQFTLSLSQASGQPVSVSYTTADDSARAGNDYTAQFGTITFTPGQTSQTLSIPVWGDATFEPDEQFHVRLTAPAHATLAWDQALGQIRNDDPAPQISINDVTIAESIGGSIAQFTVRLSKASTEAVVSVNYATQDDGARAGFDYRSTAGIVQFGPGVIQAAVRVPVLDDGIFEADETFFVNLSGAVNGEIISAQGWATIRDNDTPSTIFLRDAQIVEGDAGSTELVFPVELDRPSGVPVLASFATRDGNATAGSDYVPSTGQIRIEPATTNGTLRIPVQGDLTAEPNETFLVDLRDPVNGLEGRFHAVGTILDDDTRRLSISDGSVIEPSVGVTAEIVFTVSLNKASPDPLTVQFTTADRTATANTDYLPHSGSLTFPPGSTSQNVSITVLGDNSFEPDEQFVVQLSNPSQGVLTDPQGTGTILNDEDALAIVPAGMGIEAEDCTPNNGAIDPGEIVTVRFALANIGTLPAAIVSGRLLPTPGVTPLNAAQTYGILPPKSEPVGRTFAFKADGECGQTIDAQLEIQNDGTNYGTVSFSFMLGTNIAGSTVCCRSTDLGLTVTTAPQVSVNRELTYSVQVANLGPRTATDVHLTNSWRAAVQVIAATSDQGACVVEGQAVLCSLGSIEPGATVNVQMVLAPQEAGPLIGVFYGKALEHDSNLKNNTATAATSVIPPPGLSISNARIIEANDGNPEASFIVWLGTPTGREVSVEYSTSDGTARAGEDYTAATDLVTIGPGSPSAVIRIPIRPDTLIEPDETFTVTLRNPINAPLATEQTTGVGTIVDDDAPVLSIEDVNGIEPAAGSSGSVTFALRLSTMPARAVTFDFLTRDGTAQAQSDYLASSGQVTLESGVTFANVTVQLLPDHTAEPDEDFFLVLTNVAGAQVARTQARAIIADGSPSSLPQVRIGNTSVVEGPARSSTNAVFQLALSRPSSQPVRVDYSTASGSALGGSDFVISAGTVSFRPGETNGSVVVSVNGDEAPEATETFLVRLADPVNATLGVAEATGTIINDDYLPLLQPAGIQLVLENCQPSNQAIDPLETVTVNFGLVNRGLGPTTDLSAALRTADSVFPLSNAQSYGALPTSGAPAFRPFTFLVAGTCGQKQRLELELRDGGQVVGNLAFEVTLGALVNGEYACCTSADLGVEVQSFPEPATLQNPLTYFITVTNHGPTTATGLLITNRFNSPVHFLSQSGLGNNCSMGENQLVCALDDLAPGESVRLTNVVAPTVLPSLVGFVVVGANEADFNPGNNVAVVASTVVPPTGISIDNASVVEGETDRRGEMVVRIWPPRNQPVSFEFDFVSGTAQAGVDFVPASGTLVVPPNVITTNLSATIKADDLDEQNEDFTVILRNPVNAQIARSSAVWTIIDDDVPVLTINDVAVNVGTNAAAVAVLTAMLSSPAPEEILVEFSTSNGTAVAGTDFEAQQGTLVIPVGAQSYTLRIPISGNTADEGEERFFVKLTLPRNVTLANDTATVTITDEAPADLSISNASAAEGDSTAPSAVFTIALRQQLQHAVTVDYFTSDGTAIAGTDYTPIRGSVVLSPGTLQTNISVPVLDDLLFETPETFFLNLTNALNATIRNHRGTGSILDNELPPCVSIEDGVLPEGNSGVTQASLWLRLSGPSSEPVSVEVQRAACQSSSLPQSSIELVVFSPGETEKTFTVAIRGDEVYEADETCFFTLSNPLNARICRGQAVLTIRNDDPLPGLEIGDVSVREGDTGTVAATFTVALVGATSEPVTVHYSTRDVSATSSVDYTMVSGDLTFAPGTTSARITVLVHGDQAVETDETFEIELSSPTRASLFTSRAVGTILNDDTPAQSDCPTVVTLATAGDQSCFQPFAPIPLIAHANGDAEKIDRVEFYSGSTLIGVDTSAPFEIIWEAAAIGDYCLSARAICASGQSTASDPLCIGVTDVGAAIAIIRNFDDPEIHALREYLLEMGYCAQVFDQAGLTLAQVSGFQLIIWNDLGAEGLADGTAAALGEAFASGIPVYLIGERLASAGARLNAADRAAWSNLSRLTPLNRSEIPGTITFSTETQAREPGSILTGRFGEIPDFAYGGSVDLGTSSAGATSLASVRGADLFVQSPSMDAQDLGEPRTVSQSFRVGTFADEAGAARKALFQNAVCWLLRCSFCQQVYLTLLNSEVPTQVNVGDEFSYEITAGNNGECIASGTVVTNQLPRGVGLVSVSFNRGISVEYDAPTRTLVWRVGTVRSGSDNWAVLTLTVRAQQPGAFKNIACGTANQASFNESNCSEFDLRIEGTGPLEPPTLTLLQTAPGSFQLRLNAAQAGNYQIQTSSDLSNWLPWTNAPGPVSILVIPPPSLPPAKTRFFRTQ